MHGQLFTSDFLREGIRETAIGGRSTFPIVREQDEARFNRYRTKELVLGYMNALNAGDTTTVLAL